MSQAAEVPKPPEDLELRNIIDKLAQFVAKNGPEFENMTKQKQKDNPRFSFLYGGENFHYYMYRVTVEQAISRKRQQVEQHQQPNVPQTKIQMLQGQIKESESNLKAQYDVLMKQQENEVNEAIRVALERQIFQVAQDLRLNISELGSILDGLAYPYAHEGQEVAVNWIFAHYSTPKHGELLVRYLLERIKDPREYFQRKLSILYLVTSLVQRSIREQNEHMVALLIRFAPIMSSYAMKLHGQQDDRLKSDLDQLVRSWIQQHLLGEMAEWRCSNIDETISQYQNELRSEYADIVAEVAQRIQNQYRQYEMQHHEYARHIQQQIVSEQYQQQQQATAVMASQLPQAQQQQQPTPTTTEGAAVTQQQSAPPPRRSRFDEVGPAGVMPNQGPPPPSLINPLAQATPPGVSPWQQPPPLIAAAITSRPGASVPPQSVYSHPPPNVPPSVVHFPPPPQQHQQQPPPFQHAWPPGGGNVPPPQGQWMSAPPPGAPSGPMQSIPFGPALPPPGVCVNLNVSQPPPKPLIPASAPIDEQSLIPKVSYYDLPAGLMAPLIKMEDHEYVPLTPGDLRLPAPMPPSERLLASVEAFYAPPNHENPRDSDGWERLGLYEYYKEKAKAMHRSSSKSKKNLMDTSTTHSPPGRDNEKEAKRPVSGRVREEEKDGQGRGRRHSGNGKRNTTSPSQSPTRGEERRSTARNRSLDSPSSRKRRSRRSQSSEYSSSSRGDSRSSHSGSSDRSDSHSRSSSPKSSSRQKKSDRRERKEHERSGSRWNRDRDSSRNYSSGEEHDDREHYRGLGTSTHETSGTELSSMAQRSDPFESFRRAQSNEFNQRLRATFQAPPR